MHGPRRSCVLVLGAGDAWEPAALPILAADRNIVVLKRCVDVTDLLAAATTGQAHVAVLGVDVPGLDATAVAHLRSHQVEPLAVVPDESGEPASMHLRRLGINHVVVRSQLNDLPALVQRAALDPGLHGAPTQAPSGSPHPNAASGGDPGERQGPHGPAVPLPADAPPQGEAPGGRAVVVWGPAGAPGRTTLALGLAGELGRRGRDPLVLDVDPWGGAVGQHLGILEEVSGLLASARASANGDLPGHFLRLQRRAAGIRVLTGLPRADRWTEIRSGTVPELVELGREQGDVILDVGFSLEGDPAAEHLGRTGRNAMTLEAIEVADELVVVGNADPVGLARLARGLVELAELTQGRPVRVVVNRMRASLGWTEREVAAMVSGFGAVATLHFLPDDRPATDRALVSGRTLTETGDSPLVRGISQVVDALDPASARVSRGLRRRRGATARRR
ncbi:hypothetical protein [Nocardioides sp. AE5]|uniref:AAA family ATPase n=1 Tax=Nocardioides sp. AE5 TaxID=2962573 RepID=UPI002882C6D8|nr:hypothetical protein [Nocardioides sp. AE5]MDT0201885.1 hypothetical protein [Nocardioides sp. AE5]